MTTSAQTMLGMTDNELSAWARNWHWKDCAEDKPVDPSIYPRDLRMLKAFIDERRAAPPATGDVRRALERAESYFELIRLKLIDCLNEPERSAFWAAVEARDLIRSLASVAPGPSEAAIQKSAPVCLSAHNSGERDPAVTPDWAGADTAPSL